MKAVLEHETELLERVKNGDRPAFESLVDFYRTRVFGTLYNLLGAYQEVEEVFWDVWAEVWRSLPRFRGESSFSTWIYSIATHLAYRQRRKRFRFFKPLDEALDTADPRPGPESQALQGESHRMLERVIKKLPDNLRTPLVLHAIAELSYEEISGILHIPVGALKTRVWRAKLELKRRLDHGG